MSKESNSIKDVKKLSIPRRQSLDYIEEKKPEMLCDSKKKVETSGHKYIKFEIRIKDSGMGISEENLSKLFMNFGKLEEHAAGNKRGTGLGLSICKSLIELMGGSVTVESEVGVGTTFIMHLTTKCKYSTNNRQWIKDFKSENRSNGLSQREEENKADLASNSNYTGKVESSKLRSHSLPSSRKNPSNMTFNIQADQRPEDFSGYQ